MVMKVTYGILMAFFFVTMPLYAQDHSSGDRQPPSAADIVAMLQTKLNLTQDQVTAITPIIEKYSSKRQVLRQSIQDGSADRKSIRSQMKQLKADEKQELSQVLSTDQLSKMEQMQSQRRKRISEGVSEGGGEGSGNGG